MRSRSKNPQKSILILGGGIMQIPSLRIAKEWGWRVSCADVNGDAPGRPMADEFFPVDLKDEEGLIVTARTIRDKHGLDGVFTAGTDFSVSVARVAEALGLPGIPVDAARRATDKALMRQTFRESGVPSPDFMEIGPMDDIAAAASRIPGPWVVKPVDAMGARGVRRIDDPREFAEALAAARLFSRTGRALAETYMEGPEYSLDAVVENGKVHICGVADRHIRFPPFFVEVGHTIPAEVSPAVRADLEETFARGIIALGITTGAAKGDLKLTDRGPMVGEIAARLSGGFMSGWTYPLASGVEPTRAALRLAVGLPASPEEPSQKRVCVERALISVEGTLAGLDGVDEARGIAGVDELFLHVHPGARVRFPRNNVEKVANVIATAARREEAERAAEAALRRLEVLLDPADDSTGVYLESTDSFPPDVFEIDEGRLGAFLRGFWERVPPRPLRRPPSGWRGPVGLPGIEDYRNADLYGRIVGDILDGFYSKGLLSAGEGGHPEEPVSSFWKALIRGGAPGARWYLDRAS